ncbi:cytochrome c biogenesis protein ResB [Geomesophilobacter sediminis]|uniref:Cytochrome c biogenesis protein ResB n=1 Tax=Geomesophilobacter sediminis TaxID=2798584 RepID=A0A8J7S7F8_9BACT|nr:cytochrome c biogenesis protein ResB [Geomesophilobacter sediminis]MBJ6727016.1 cytochrome c biogenesis protein ResB [Geomesophilobacter sediminis]
MNTTKRGFAYQLWDFFCSLRLSIFLLIGLALVSIIGTIIPQGNPPQEYLQTISETKFKLYQQLGFFDMYHSWWFILLLYFLTLNLICCSIKRLPRVWKIISEPVLVMDDRFETSLSITRDVKMTGAAASIKDQIVSFLKQEFAEPVVTEVNGEYHLFAQKHAWCRLGVYVVHFSIIIVFIGAIIGSFAGYKGYVNIPEGGSISRVVTRNGKAVDLGFAVRCEKFSVAFYDTGAPKEFKSLLTVLENGQPVAGKQNIPVIVNEPLTYKGVTFYQSSYGPSDEGASYHISVKNRKTGAATQITARQGERVALPGGAFLSVMEGTADVRPFMKDFDGPGAQVEFTPPGGQPQPFVILGDKYQSFNEQHGGDLVLTLASLDQKFYTGLQVAKDPGVLVVWLGCALMVVGICMAFFMSHKRLWARVTDGSVTFGGSASKNPAGFELSFDELMQKLNKG